MADYHIGLVAGEASGDQLGSRLMAALREREPGTRFTCIAGPRMRAAGCNTFAESEQLAVMGLFEVMSHLPGLWRLRRRYADHLLTAGIDLLVGIDAPDFNLGLEKRLKRAGIPVLHWVSPSVWAWRRYRMDKIRRSTNKVLTLFPFEQSLYETYGVPSEFVGHPLADDIGLNPSRYSARGQLGLETHRMYAAMLPGSRRAEIERLLPVFLDTALQCQAQMPELQWLLPVASPELRPLIDAIVGRPAWRSLPVRLVDDQSRLVMAAAEAVLVASGTATLECLLSGRPMVVAYRMNGLSYAIASRMLQVPYVSLPNNLLGRYQVPEFLQDEARPESLAAALLPLLQDPGAAAQQVEPFAELHRDLRCNAIARVADTVLESLHAKHQH